jgi:hypothetical protein
MAKNTLNFAQQNSERAVQATNWMRAIAEHNLNQSKAAFEGLLTIARNAVRGVDQQAAAIREHSMQFAEETLSNTFDLANRVVRMKEPQEFAQIQTEFLSRQAQLLGDQTKELGERIMQGVDDAAKTALEGATDVSSRRRSEAA